VTVTHEQEQLAGMPRRLFTATPSRLGCWQDCPRRYRFTYVDRPTPAKGPPWAHNSVGAAVHTALAAWWDLPLGRRTPESAAGLVRARWIPIGFRDEAQSQRWCDRAADMVQRYVAGVDPHDEPVGVERTVGMATERLAFSGRIDRLDRRGEDLVVVDYKTGRHVLSTDDTRGSLALALYALAAARTLRRRCVRVELHHLPTGEVLEWEHDGATLDRHLQRAHALADEISAAQDFPPNPGPMCGWCDFSAHCPEGRAAAAPKAPWDGLAEDLSPPDDVTA
jgi:RecB family exonuclease